MENIYEEYSKKLPEAQIKNRPIKRKSLGDLYDIICSRIDACMDYELTPEERIVENTQSALIFSGIKQAVNVTDAIIRTEKLEAQAGILKNSEALKLVHNNE